MKAAKGTKHESSPFSINESDDEQDLAGEEHNGWPRDDSPIKSRDFERGNRNGNDAVQRKAGAEQEQGQEQGWRDVYLTVEFLNVLIMSVAFLLLFAAYNTIQNYVTSLLPGTP